MKNKKTEKLQDKKKKAVEISDLEKVAGGTAGSRSRAKAQLSPPA